MRSGDYINVSNLRLRLYSNMNLCNCLRYVGAFTQKSKKQFRPDLREHFPMVQDDLGKMI